MLLKVKLKKIRQPNDFLSLSSPQERRQLMQLAKDLLNKKIVHLNATAQGGGVAEILSSLLPYCRALGLKADWYVINPEIAGNFFKITNKFFDGLQGKKVKISPADWREYEKKSQLIAEKIDKLGADILVINDSQPLLAGYLAKAGPAKIFYSHVDSSNPDKSLWQKFLPYFKDYQKIVFSNRDFINQSATWSNKIVIFPPAIDPLALKQKIVAKKTARLYLKGEATIPLSGPLIVQVSRFDAWKNPLGLIDAFSLVQKKKPSAQLALVGFNVAKDNPAARLTFDQVEKAAKGFNNIHLFFQPQKKSVEEFTMMAQNAADIVVQNSYREGFGLTVSEAMWKGKAVIGGPAAGIRKQIKHKRNGLIANNSRELANYLEELLDNREKREKLAKEGKKTVRKKFLMTRLLLDHFKLYKKL